MPNEGAQERALQLLEEAVEKAEMLLIASPRDQLLVRSLLQDLEELRAQLDGLKSCRPGQEVPSAEFWRLASPIFSKIVELLFEKLFK